MHAFLYTDLNMYTINRPEKIYCIIIDMIINNIGEYNVNVIHCINY